VAPPLRRLMVASPSHTEALNVCGTRMCTGCCTGSSTQLATPHTAACLVPVEGGGGVLASVQAVTGLAATRGRRCAVLQQCVNAVLWTRVRERVQP
jgi:hypothetical protein